MNDQLTTANQPFHTTNAILAFCLWRAGIPFWLPEQPCIVLYNLDMVRKFTDSSNRPIFAGRDWTRDWKEIINEAHKRGFRGRVIYVFRPTIRLKEMIQSFQYQEEELKQETVTVESLVKDIVGKWLDGKMEDDEALLRLACIDLKTRVEFMELWMKMVPWMEHQNEGEVSKHTEPFVTKEGKVVSSEVYEHPGAKWVSINASEATLEHLGLLQ